MNKTFFVAAALAAGLVNSAAHAQDSERRYDPVELQKAFEAQKASAGGAAAPDGVDPTTTASIPAAAKPAAKAASGVDLKAVKSGYSGIISRYAAEYGVPVALAHAVVSVESNFRPQAKGRAGEIGLMQIKPSTARMMGYSGSAKGLFDPETNIKYGMKYLAKAQSLGGGDTCGTILKYNAGHAAKRMNPVSAAYCAKVKRAIGS
jgi:soluble lytic murein transglycosylase-like protein